MLMLTIILMQLCQIIIEQNNMTCQTLSKENLVKIQNFHIFLVQFDLWDFMK